MTKTEAPTRRGRPSTEDEFALRFYFAKMIDQGLTVTAATQGGFSFYGQLGLGPDGNEIIYHRRVMSAETARRKYHKAGSSFKLQGGQGSKNVPSEFADGIARQAFANGRYTWGGSPQIPAGLTPLTKPKVGRPRESSSSD